MQVDKEVFDGKKLGDILKEAYEKHKEQDSLIKNEIFRLSDMISSPGEALAIAPMIKPLIDSGLKNDEVLMKIAQLIQKSVASDDAAANDSILTEKDMEQLFSEVQIYTKKEHSIKELPNS
jgi:hypothetical protein